MSIESRFTLPNGNVLVQGEGYLKVLLENGDKVDVETDDIIDDVLSLLKDAQIEKVSLRRAVDKYEYALNALHMGNWESTLDESGLEVWTTKRINPPRIAYEALTYFSGGAKKLGLNLD